ncbi:MAG: 4-alpha-glucanotransferase [Oscillospiraceae bacterium]|jgi:4-alpha-glucanotransferase|nr:4-alpha-glucanotransferase [Oscillospiraceae bacterium]
MDNKSYFNRSSGVLLPVFSLPSPYGIGSFGKEAMQWVDFLSEAKQRYWQILPLGPVGFGASPYQSLSAFAGNPYYIDLDILCNEGLLAQKDFKDINWGRVENRVDYSALYNFREPVLRKAFSNFKDEAALDEFISHNHWFLDYGLYMAVKASQKNRSWIEWDEPWRLFRSELLSGIGKEMQKEIRYHAFLQYQFLKQYRSLRAYAKERGVRIIGDIPIYVSLDSADVWKNPELFQLDKNSYPSEVAGVPPDFFSSDGQIWGNPLYDWEAHVETGFEWWIRRLKSNFELYDVVRIDHFRGLESYYVIGRDEKTAANGRWVKGPGMDFVNAIRQAVPKAGIIAEDLGFLTHGVRKLLRESAFPGMKVLQYAFDSEDPEDHPDMYTENTVVYTGTHDNETIKGWSKTADLKSCQSAMEYLNISQKSGLPQAMMRECMRCRANLAIIPMQDWLELDSYARINTPSTVSPYNWSWRLGKNMLSGNLAEYMAELTSLYGRSL